MLRPKNFWETDGADLDGFEWFLVGLSVVGTAVMVSGFVWIFQ